MSGGSASRGGSTNSVRYISLEDLSDKWNDVDTEVIWHTTLTPTKGASHSRDHPGQALLSATLEYTPKITIVHKNSFGPPDNFSIGLDTIIALSKTYQKRFDEYGSDPIPEGLDWKEASKYWQENCEPFVLNPDNRKIHKIAKAIATTNGYFGNDELKVSKGAEMKAKSRVFGGSQSTQYFTFTVEIDYEVPKGFNDLIAP